MESDSQRPSKLQECVICQRKSNDGKWLQGRMAIMKDLSALLEKYGGITLTKGYMCSKCVRFLLGIHKRVQQFRAMCQKSPHNVVTHKLVKVPPPKGNKGALNSAPMKLVPITNAVSNTSGSLDSRFNVTMTKERTALGLGLVVQIPPLSALVNNPQVSVITSGAHVPMNSHLYQPQAPSQSITRTTSNISVGGAPQAVLIPVQPAQAVERVMPPLGIPQQRSFQVGQALVAGSPSRPKLIAPKKNTVASLLSEREAPQQVSNNKSTVKESVTSKNPGDSNTSQDKEPETEAPPPAPYSSSDDHCYHQKRKSATDILLRYANEWLRYRSNRDTEYLGVEDIKKLVSKVVEGSMEKLAEAAMRIPPLRRRIVAYLMTDIDTSLVQISNRKRGPLSCLKPEGFANSTVFDWESVILEMDTVVPDLLHICVAATNRAAYLEKFMDRAAKDMMPRIGMVFAIFSQGRVKELNKVQRAISLLLRKNGCDGKRIYQRLNQLGVCTSYPKMLEQMHAIAEEKKKKDRERKRKNKGESSSSSENDDSDEDVLINWGQSVRTSSAVASVQTPSSASAAQTTAASTSAAPSQQGPTSVVSRFGGSKKIFLVPKSK